MADSAKKPAAKKQADSSPNVTDKQAEKAFAEPDNYEGVDQPTESLSPAESLQRDQEKAAERESVEKIRDDLNSDLDEKREKIRNMQDPGARYRAAAFVCNIPVVDGGELIISSVGGQTFLEISGKRAVLDREGAINAAQRLNEAFQAAS